jgi:mRNA interferase RelE/StbE
MWKVEYTKRFLKELANLPEEIQARVEPIIFQELEAENPFELGYLQKLKGYTDKYKRFFSTCDAKLIIKMPI